MIDILTNPKFWRGVSIGACIIMVVNAVVFPSTLTISAAISGTIITIAFETLWRTLDA